MDKADSTPPTGDCAACKELRQEFEELKEALYEARVIGRPGESSGEALMRLLGRM